jgi:orotate phosphoribosyltransferase
MNLPKEPRVLSRQDEIKEKALRDLRDSHVLMIDGHFDYGNGYHGPVYLNPHQLLRHPSTIWRFAQDLLDVLPAGVIAATEVVAGPVTGGALLAHTIAGLLDSRRGLTHPPCSFAPFDVDRVGGKLRLRGFYREAVRGKRVLLADDVRNTGQTFEQCAALAKDAGAVIVATVEIYDRGEAVAKLDAPNHALAEYAAPDNFKADQCPLCKSGVPIAAF